LKRVLKQNWKAILWALIIMLLTGLPGNYFPEIISFWEWISPDKVVHLFVFGVLSFLILYENKVQYFKGKHRSLLLICLLTGIAYGALTEVLQFYVFVGRHGNFYDFYANVAGVFSGMALFMLIYRKNKKLFTGFMINY
jgi:VanZ family protein